MHLFFIIFNNSKKIIKKTIFIYSVFIYCIIYSKVDKKIYGNSIKKIKNYRIITKITIEEIYRKTLDSAVPKQGTAADCAQANQLTNEIPAKHLLAGRGGMIAMLLLNKPLLKE